jgi:MFS family permease
LRKLSPNFRRFLLVSCFFSLSYFSFAFLILRASQSGIGLENILAAYAFYNVIYALFSIPIGQWSDKIGRKPVIVASFLIYSLVLAGFAYLSSVLMLAVLLAFYAIFVAADESVSKAFIADLSEKRAWGMALGAYNSAVGATYLISSLIAGALWAALGPAFTFLFASFIAFLSAILMAFYVK